MNIQHNVDLTSHNTLRLGARARAFACFHSEQELSELCAWAQQQQLPVKVIGGGSNVLLTQDVDALILQSAMQEVRLIRDVPDGCIVRVDAGKNWHQWVCDSIQYGSGLENLALIPGTVGAAPVQNIGAYGTEVSDCLQAVTGMQLSTGKIQTLTREECRFGYRDSVFKNEHRNDFIILNVEFRLNKIFSPTLSYGPVAEWAKTVEVTPEGLIAEIMRIRSGKLPDPQIIPNAGSFFKNPVVSAEQAAELHLRFAAMPEYVQPDGSVKLAAGWLIEQAGWKGRWCGAVGMHKDQALVLVTDGKACYGDVAALVGQVQDDIRRVFGVQLEPEPQPF